MFKPLLKVIVLFFTFTRLFYCTNKKKSRRIPYVELLIKVFRNKFAIRQGGISMVSTVFVILVRPYYLKEVTSR